MNLLKHVGLMNQAPTMNQAPAVLEKVACPLFPKNLI